MATLDKSGGIIATDANGDPVSGALLYAFEAGTTTPVTLYTDKALTIAHASPVVADSSGVFAAIYASDDDLKIDVQTSAGASLPGYPRDDYNIFDMTATDARIASLEAQLGVSNPFYLAVGGQSNSIGSDGGSGTNWITEGGKVFVWVPASNTFQDVLTMQGQSPFNTDGSNSPAVHAALDIANKYGVVVRMVMGANGSTELSEWTGGGFANGVAISTDRTVSASNRVQFKKFSDAVTDGSIAQFDAFSWWQGEADLDTPESTYLSELSYLVEQVKALGTASDDARNFATAVHGLYTGPNAGQQATRSRSLEKFARQNPGTVGFVSVHDLEGRDDDLADPDNVINHFTSSSYKLAGERAGSAIRGVRSGAYMATDQRVLDVVIPAQGLSGEKLGSRSHQMDDFTGVSEAITGATEADPCVITSTAHGLATGERIRIFDVVGMTELNDKLYTVTVADDDSYSLDGVDSSAFTTYTSGGEGQKVLELLIDNGAMRGEIYPLSGDVTIQLDPNANDALGDGGIAFEFVTLSNADSVHLRSDNDDGTTRQIQLMDGEGPASTLDITGTAGITRVVYRGSRYEVVHHGRNSHSDAVLEAGTNTLKKKVSPAQLRTAGVASYAPGFETRNGVSDLTTDASSTISAGFSTVIYSATLTGDRVVRLSSDDRFDGEITVITRKGGGDFTLRVRDDDSSDLVGVLAVDETAVAVYDGTKWRQIGAFPAS